MRHQVTPKTGLAGALCHQALYAPASVLGEVGEFTELVEKGVAALDCLRVGADRLRPQPALAAGGDLAGTEPQMTCHLGLGLHLGP